MGITSLLQAVTTASSVGLGCGTCCSPSITVFLSTYLVSHGGGMKKSLWSYVHFFLGKVCAVLLACLAASFIGLKLVDDQGYLGPVNLSVLVNVILGLVGVVLSVRWIYGHFHRKDGCKSCGHCKDSKDKIQYTPGTNGTLPLFVVGFTYGISPCAPMILMIGYAATMTVFHAAAMGVVFALASSLTPMLLLALLSGALSGRMAKEIPEYIDWFRLLCYVLLIFFSVAALGNL